MGYNPCPLCGKSDRISVTSKEDYYELLALNGLACISMRCRNCHIEMFEHTSSIRVYEKKVEKLYSKWNRLRGVPDEAVDSL